MCGCVGKLESDVFAGALEEALGCRVEENGTSDVTGISIMGEYMLGGAFCMRCEREGGAGLQGNPAVRAHQVVELEERGYACGLSGCAHTLVFYADESFEILFAYGFVGIADAKGPKIDEAGAVGLDK